TRLIASLAVPGKPLSGWSVPILGGEPQELAEEMHYYAVSPDGAHILFGRVSSAWGEREIWLMGPNGESPRKILSASGRSFLKNAIWSPAGNRFAYTYVNHGGQEAGVLKTLASCDLN